ncbi:MAG: DUF4251 domain-containing protein [Bacteroidaceae bacterium]|nr:DUF4251 domain-containing protein [Bacteroidaceae bacterium]
MKEREKSSACKAGFSSARIAACRAVLLLALLTATAFAAYPQEKKEKKEKKMTLREKEDAWRAERLKKRARDEKIEFQNDSIQHAQAIIAIRDGSWALEASNVTFNNGVTNYVTPSMNYVSINDGTGTIQTAFDNTNVYSPNGLGGVTLEGSISNEELTLDKEGNVYYSYFIQGSNLSASVSIVITANSNQATANINPNFNGRNMMMTGYIYPYDTAGVFQGTPDY